MGKETIINVLVFGVFFPVASDMRGWSSMLKICMHGICIHLSGFSLRHTSDVILTHFVV